MTRRMCERSSKLTVTLIRGATATSGVLEREAVERRHDAVALPVRSWCAIRISRARSNAEGCQLKYGFRRLWLYEVITTIVNRQRQALVLSS